MKLFSNISTTWILIVFIAIVILARINWHINMTNEEQEHKQRLINEIKSALRGDLLAVEILPDQISEKKFIYTLKDSTELQWFKKSASLVDSVPIGGHNGPIYEATIVIKTKDKALKYLATVNRYNSEDLYLSNIFWVKKYDGSYHRGPSFDVRVPKLGSWIIEKAPMGLISKR